MEKTDSVLTEVAHLMNYFPIRYYRLDILKANLWTWKLHTIDPYLDNDHSTTIYLARYCILAVVGNHHINGLYDNGLNIIIMSLDLIKALRL